MKRIASALIAATVLLASSARADETCLSPYLPKITGQEDYLYVYTLGVEGMGDGNDKVVTVGANPSRPGYGKVVHVATIPGRHEAHHGDFSDDRRHLWLAGLDTSEIFVFDVATEPGKPKLVKTIKDFVTKSGVVGPHTFNALPGRMLITGLSNAQDLGGRTGMVEYNNAGEYVRTVWMPKGAEYGYDARINVNLNRLLTSSFTGKKNYMRPLPELMGDAEAMKQFGNTMVVWDAHARKALQTLQVPGAPLEVRWALQPRHHYAFTATALDSRLWGVFRKDDGTFEAVNLAPIGDPAKLPLLTVDISLSADDRFLFADNFVSGTVHVFDVSDPRKPKQVYERKIGEQLNMVSQTWDGKRLYFSSSLLANWDKTGAANEQFVRAFDWDGTKLEPRFSVDFTAEKLGRPHLMRFGQEGFWVANGAPRAVGE